MKNTILFVAICAALAGCATKQYAQVGDVTPYEKNTLTCHEIDIEIAKTQGIQQSISETDKFDGKSVLAFLGDFGIGNAMARSAAEDSTTKRMAELRTLRGQKNCPLSTATAN